MPTMNLSNDEHVQETEGKAYPVADEVLGMPKSELLVDVTSGATREIRQPVL